MFRGLADTSALQDPDEAAPGQRGLRHSRQALGLRRAEMYAARRPGYEEAELVLTSPVISCCPTPSSGGVAKRRAETL